MHDQDALAFIETQTGDRPAGTVIWLHGLGASGHDFEPIVPMLPLSVDLRFIFPHAPTRAITINGGMEMPAWYDINPASPLDSNNDIAASVAAVTQVVAREIERGCASENITIAGFSQGGVIALELGLSHPKPLGGIMALSTYVHDLEHLTERVDFANVDIPIFMAHGVSDPMIPIARGITAREALTKLSYRVEWRQYGMGHEVCPEQINHIGQWLNQIYAK